MRYLFTKNIKWSFQFLKYNVVYTRTRATVELAHKIYGSVGPVPPVFVLHGLLGSKRNWNSMSKMIQESTKRAVIAVDARNHGESPHAKSHEYLDLAADVHRLMGTLAIKEASFLGHSMGGRTAMTLALTEPTRVSSLVIVDISPVSFPSESSDFFQKLMDLMKSITFEGNDLSKAKNEARQKLQASGLIEHNSFLEFLLLSLEEKDGKIRWHYNVDVLKDSFRNIARFPTELAGKVYPGPTLFIGGSRSHFLPESDLPLIKQIFPLAMLHVVPNAGHNIHTQTPQAFHDIVSKFIIEYTIK